MSRYLIEQMLRGGAVLRKLRHPAIVEFKGVGAMNAGSAEEMRRSMFLVQVCCLIRPCKHFTLTPRCTPGHCTCAVSQLLVIKLQTRT